MHRTSFISFGVYDEKLAEKFRTILGTERAYPIRELGVLVIDGGLLTSTKMLHDVDPSCDYHIDNKLVDDGYDDSIGRSNFQKISDNKKALNLTNLLLAFSDYFAVELFNEDLKKHFAALIAKGAVDCEIFADDTDSFDQNKQYAFYHLKPSERSECIIDTYRGPVRVPIDEKTVIIKEAYVSGIRCLGKAEIETVIFTQNVSDIGAHALEHCPDVRHIAIENSRVKIEQWAFSDCKKLERVEITSYELLKNKNAWWEDRFSREAVSIIALDYYGKKDHIARHATTNAVQCLRHLLKNNREDLVPKLLEVRHPINSRLLVFLMICASQEGREDVLALLEKYAAENFKPQNIEKAKADYYAKLRGEKEKSDSDLSDEFLVGQSVYDGEVEIFEYAGVDTDVVVPEVLGGKKVSNIWHGGFQNLNFIKSVSVPKGVSLYRYVFAGCTSLESARLHTSPSENTFQDCVALKRVEIVGKHHMIKDNAFLNCENLMDVVFADDLCAIERSAFANTPNLKCQEYDNGIYLGAQGNPYYAFLRLKDPTVNKCVIHPDTKIFARDAFLSSFETFELSIGEDIGLAKKGRKKKPACELRGFENCKGLKRITVPAGITSLGRDVFAGCTALESVSLPDTLVEVENSAFKNCVSLREIDLPDSIAKMQSFVFEGCAALKQVKLPANITYLGYNWFAKCLTLKEFVIPEGVVSIYHGCFDDCYSLKRIVLPSTLEEISDWAFAGCRSLSEVQIPDSVKEIGALAFRNCQSLRKIVLPLGLKRIAHSTFENCGSLESVEIPNGVTEIASEAFLNCYSLENVVFSGNVKKIGKDAFSGCKKCVFHLTTDANSELLNMLKPYQRSVRYLNDSQGKCEAEPSPVPFGKWSALSDDVTIEYKDKIFVLTGFDFADENSLTEQITQRGGSIKSSVVLATDYLVVNTSYTGAETTKYQRAVELNGKGKNIRIISGKKLIADKG